MSELVVKTDENQAKPENLDPDEEVIEASRAPLLDHLTELRDRLIWCVSAVFIGFAICWFFWKPILEFLLVPYKEAAISVKGIEALKNGLGLIYTAPMETVFAQLDVALFGGVCIAFPMIAYQLYRFIAPGLYTNEKKAFYPFLVMSPALFIAGAAMAYYVAMPMVMSFSLQQEITASVGGVAVNYQGKISDYIKLITMLILAFGISFQLPVIQLFLGRAGLVESQFWFNGGKYAILAIVTLSAFITPPDIVSQALLSLPVIAIYYLGALLVKLIEKKEKAES